MRPAFVGEVSREDAAVADVLAVTILLFVDDAETVAGLNFEREIDLPAEDIVGEPHDDFGADAGGTCRDEQRGIDRAVSVIVRISIGVATTSAAKPALAALDREHFCLADPTAE